MNRFHGRSDETVSACLAGSNRPSRRSCNGPTSNHPLLIIPPVGVFLQVGIGGHFWLNILLTILGYFPD